MSFVRDLVEHYAEPCDALVFLQTIEHVQEPERVLRRFRDLLRPGGTAYVSTPNLLTLAPPGAEKSDNPWHVKEYRAEEFRELCASAFGQVELLGLFHARVLRAHELALRRGGTACTPGWGSHAGSTTASPRRCPRATSRCATVRSSERSTSSRF